MPKDNKGIIIEQEQKHNKQSHQLKLNEMHIRKQNLKSDGTVVSPMYT